MKRNTFINLITAASFIVLIAIVGVLTGCQAESTTPPVIVTPIEVTPVTPVIPTVKPPEQPVEPDGWVIPKRKLGDGKVVPAPYGYIEMCKRDPGNVLCP